MEPIYWAALLSFVAGACGYVIVRFWIVPIVRYQRLKGQLFTRLDAYVGVLPADDAQPLKAVPAKKHLRDLRRIGVRMASVHDGELPYWYRLILMTRRESPASATDPIIRLENMPTGGQARRCIAEIKKNLGRP